MTIIEEIKNRNDIAIMQRLSSKKYNGIEVFTWDFSPYDDNEQSHLLNNDDWLFVLDLINTKIKDTDKTMYGPVKMVFFANVLTRIKLAKKRIDIVQLSEWLNLTNDKMFWMAFASSKTAEDYWETFAYLPDDDKLKALYNYTQLYNEQYNNQKYSEYILSDALHQEKYDELLFEHIVYHILSQSTVDLNDQILDYYNEFLSEHSMSADMFYDEEDSSFQFGLAHCLYDHWEKSRYEFNPTFTIPQDADRALWDILTLTGIDDVNLSSWIAIKYAKTCHVNKEYSLHL